MAATHSLEHRSFVEGCYLCRLRSISIAPAALPTRQDARYLPTDKLEKGWQKDVPAFKRLERDGLNPARVDGAADLEARAESREQIESETYDPIVEAS